MIRTPDRDDTPVSESLAQVFPARLAPAVASVVHSIPGARIRPARSVTASQSSTWPGLVVTGELIVVPKRIYNPEPSPHAVTGLSHVEAVVAAAIYSRHDDGLSASGSSGRCWKQTSHGLADLRSLNRRTFSAADRPYSICAGGCGRGDRQPQLGFYCLDRHAPYVHDRHWP
jgi:hypothetical protein